MARETEMRLKGSDRGVLKLDSIHMGFKTSTRRWPAWLLLGALAASAPAFAQQKTGPGLMDEDALTWHGITLYGVVDIGLQHDTHSAPFTPYRPAASGNIVRSNDYESATGLTPSNMGQSRVGLQGTEPLVGDWSAVFQVETFFNPQSGEIANSLKSLAMNNGVPVTSQSIGVDGSSAGQAFQTAWVGFKSAQFGTLTFGRQVTLAVGGHHHVRPQLQRDGVRPARCLEYVFRRRQQRGQPARFVAEVRCGVQ